MSTSTFASSYQGYTILICVLSGLFLLGVDAPSYKSAKLLKEHKLSRTLGWIDISLGIAAFLAKIIMF